jgi:hypothetical protein
MSKSKINKKTTTRSIYYRKAEMLEYTSTLTKSPELYVTFLDSTETHRFIYFNKHIDLINNIDKLKNNNRYYIDEIVLNGQKRKPYLDLEKTYSSEHMMKKNLIKIIKKLQTDIITIFKDEYKETLTKNDILILNSSGKVKCKYKLSLHIIVSPENKTYYYTNSKFTNSSSFHLYTSLINLDNAYAKLLDPQVYKTDINFRIYGSHKNFNDDRCLLPINLSSKNYNNNNNDNDNGSTGDTYSVCDNDSDNDNVSDNESGSDNDSDSDSDNVRDNESGSDNDSDSGSDNDSDSDSGSDNDSDSDSDNDSDSDSDNIRDSDNDNNSDNNSGNDSDNDSDDESNSNDSDNDGETGSNENDISSISEFNDREQIDYFLTYINSYSVELKTPILQQTEKPIKKISSDKPTKTNLEKYLLKCVQKIHPSAVFNGLYKDIYYNFNYTDRTEKCPINGKTHVGSNGFYVFETDRGYYLKCFSKKCANKSKHIGYADITDDFIDSALQIDQRYLIMDENISMGIDADELVCKMICKWLETDDIKTFVVKSPMGTGKTTMIEKILNYDTSIKKILWITHRQTLTKQIYGKFKILKFKNYMDVEGSLKKLDRIIVQVDSLERIMSFDNNKNSFNIYDLIIIDEIEGNLNHYNSPFLNKPNRSARMLFNFMISCIQYAKKLLAIDADIGMRTKLFIDHIGKSIVINNNYKPVKKCFIVTNDRTNFLKTLFNDIDTKKNICIVSMSSSILNKLNKQIKKKDINSIMHTSGTDDKLKTKLEDVNSFWIKYQVVLYSPCIESGIDFNEDHFDKIYCIVKNGFMTCSQRSFLQMVGRIRHVRDNNILCYYNGPKILNAPMYTYDDILSYFRYYESLNNKKIIENIEYETIVENNEVIRKRKFTDISLFDNISIYNEVEQLNKHPDIFLSVLNKLIQRSGHELIVRIYKSSPKNLLKSVKIEKILSRIDESMYNFKDLMIRQSKNKLTEEHKLVLKKIFFNKTFGIKCTSDSCRFIEFFNKYRDKEISFKRFEKFFGYIGTDKSNNSLSNNDSNDESDNIEYINDQYDNFNDGKDKARHKIIIDLINRLTDQNKKNYKIDDLINAEIDNEIYIGVIKDIKNSVYFSNEAENRALFFRSKGKKFIHFGDNKKGHVAYTRFFQTLFAGYGIALRSQQKRIKGTKERFYVRYLNVDPNFKKIADFKHKITNDIDIYKELFIPSKDNKKRIIIA